MATTDTRHSARVEKSMRMYQRAMELIPGGTQLISRRPTRFAFGVSPVFVSSGKGARIRDVDGNEYIDWVSGIGAIILGYTDPVVDDAVRAQIGLGTNFSVTHELELELAEELVDTIPCAEMVRFARGGGDACAIAVRIARGATGRDKILFCGYHGWHDWYLAANLAEEANLNEHLFPGIEPTGVSQTLAGTAIPFPYGDADALGTALDAHRGEVAAVMMEPMRSEFPPQGYLQRVRKLAHEHGAVLIFDEVSTGFRLTPGGVQPWLGVTPDIAVFAKSISNGYAMGAVVGRRDVMEPAAQMFVSSTYWGETVGLRAALTTLREIRNRDVPARLKQTSQKLTAGLNVAARETGCPVKCGGAFVHPHLEFAIDNPDVRSQAGTVFTQEMAKRGCHGYTAFTLNAAQGPAEIEQTIAAARETFVLIADGLNAGRLDQLMECELRQDFFRRLVT